MKIVEYRIIYDKSSGELVSKVNQHIQQNWQPLGAPFISSTSIYQAMVKYADQY